MNEQNLSDELYEKSRELKKKLIPATFIGIQECKGKTTKFVDSINIDEWNGSRTYVLISFTDDTILLLEDWYVVTDPFLYNSFFIDSDKKGYAYFSDLGKWFEELGLWNPDIADELLKTLVKWHEINYVKSIKEQIQKKLDEISELKEEL